MLDAHPEIAMSYEIYENLLLDEHGAPFTELEVLNTLHAAYDSDDDQWVRKIEVKNLRTFVARARRGGITVQEFKEQFLLFAASKGSFVDIHGRLDFIDQLMRYRMITKGKSIWGGKARVNLNILHQRHPKAKIFMMIRDGRDVLASRLNTGAFNTNALACAQDWRQSILEFQDFSARAPNVTMAVRYETLVEEPKMVLRQICEFVGIHYDTAMLNFHQTKPDLFNNPHGHLSYQQLAKGLNQGSVGRWKVNLSKEQIEVFQKLNTDLLIEFGYLDDESRM